MRWKGLILKLWSNTRFFKFRPFYDLVEPFKVDQYSDFSAFSEIIVEIQVFQICISHWICQSQLQWTLIRDYLQWIRKFKSQAFTKNLFFLNQQLYNTVVPCHTNVFLDIIVEIQAFLDLQCSLNLFIWIVARRC
mgnify:CR=1 FL=1